MQVVFNIEGREAIPVRVLPWLTDWHFGAVQVAYALAHENDYETFKLVSAFSATSTGLKKLLPRSWISVIQALEELEDQNLSRFDWEKDATLLLPDGVYVWRDEWEAAYNESRDGPSMWERMQENDEYQEEIDVRRLVVEPASIPQRIESAINRTSAADSPNIDMGEMLRLLAIQAEVMSSQASALDIQAKTSSFASMKLDLAQHVNVQISVQQTKADDLHPDYAMKPSLVPTSKAVSPEQGCNPASAESGLDRNTENSAHTPEPIEHQNWIVVSPKRFSPYKLALQKFLQAEWQKGRLRIPTPRDVLEAWSVTKPPEIFEVMLDAFKYLNAEGEVKEVSLSALKSAIARATKVNNETARAR